MNPDKEFNDSDESDSDFCPDKEAGNDVSEVEGSSEPSSGSDQEDEVDDAEKSEKKPQRKRATKTSKKQSAKKSKTRKRADAQSKKPTTDDEDDSVGSDEEGESKPAERKRSTRQKQAEEAKSSGLQKDKLESDEEEDTSRKDALWADFLSDVKGKKVETTATTTKQSTTSPKIKENGHDAENGQAKSAKQGLKSEATPSTSSSTSTKQKIVTETSKTASAKITVTEIVDFAGEEVCVEKVVNADSVKENKTALPLKAAGSSMARGGKFPLAGLKRPMPGGSGGGGGGGGGGLGSILGQIGKKKKISVLEKSQLDWKSFKQNEGIEEELQTFNKGKDGYLERQDFLQRTDLRQFEIEKSLRQSRRSN